MAHTASKKIKAIPAKELSWVHCRGPDGDEYMITSSPDRSVYSLYKILDDGVERIAKDKTPVLFNEMIDAPKKKHR